MPKPRRERQVDEARTGDLDLGDIGCAGELGGELLGDVARLHPRGLGQHHGGIGGKLAVGGIARRGHLGGGEIEPRRQDALALQRLQCGHDPALHEGMGVHGQIQSIRGCFVPAFGSPGRLSQFRRSVKQPAMFLDGVAIGHAGNEVGHDRGAAAAARRLPGRPPVRPTFLPVGAGSAQIGR